MSGAVHLFVVFLLSVNTSWTAADQIQSLHHSLQSSSSQARPDLSAELSSPANTDASHGIQLLDPQPGHDQHVWSGSSRKLKKTDDKTTKASVASLAGYDSDIPPHLLLKDLSEGFSPALNGASSALKPSVKGASTTTDGSPSALDVGRRKLLSIRVLGGYGTTHSKEWGSHLPFLVTGVTQFHNICKPFSSLVTVMQVFRPVLAGKLSHLEPLLFN